MIPPGKELLKVSVRNQARNLLVLRDNLSIRLFDAHPLVEHFNADHGTNLKVVSHEAADAALTSGVTWTGIQDSVIDAAIAYEAPFTRLGKQVVFTPRNEPSVVLATGRYQGEEGIALVALGLSSADFKREGNSIILDIDDSRLIPVPEFPIVSGCHLPHPETGVPHRDQAAMSGEARAIVRLDGSPYVGLLVRYCDISGAIRYSVSALCPPSTKIGVVVEVPDGDVPRIEALLPKK